MSENTGVETVGKGIENIREKTTKRVKKENINVVKGQENVSENIQVLRRGKRSENREKAMKREVMNP